MHDDIGTTYEVTKTGKNEWRIKKIPRGPVGISAIILIILCVISFSISAVSDAARKAKFESNASYDKDKIVLEIVDKVPATEKTTYDNGYVTALEINVKNNTDILVHIVEGELVIYNADGKELDTGTCSFSCDLNAGEEKAFILNLDREKSKKAIELYYADIEDLSATFKLTKVTYEEFQVKEYDVDPVTILGLSEKSDGVSSLEKSYQEAMSLLKKEKYGKALSIFKDLGDYKDSIKLSNDITEIVEKNAEASAASGDYTKAYEALADIGYNTDNSNLYQAYVYAAEGNFLDAVEYGLPVIFIAEGTETIPDDFLNGANCTGLKEVILPASIKAIGNSAFYNCRNLSKINFPNGLLTIGDSAFNGTSLEKIKLPNTLQAIGEKAFAYNEAVTNVKLPSSLTSLGNSAFYGCTAVTSAIIPGNITTISNSAFACCKNLTDLTISEGVEEIGENSFEGCSALNTVALPDSLKIIGKYAFGSCGNLTEMTIPVNVVDIQTGAFGGCYNLKKLTFADTTGWIQNSAVSVNVDNPEENAYEAHSGNAWEKQ